MTESQARAEGGIFRGWFFVPIAIAWILAVGAGFATLAHEEFTPVAASTPGDNFPSNSALPHDADRPNLYLFVHPYCPCTRASVKELNEIVARSKDKAAVTVVFTIPQGLEPGWKQANLWQQAGQIPGARLIEDFNGDEAHQFHISGSGHALLYSASGELLFSGGITASRGHEGDNAGADAITDLLAGRTTTTTQTPVFGCSLF